MLRIAFRKFLLKQTTYSPTSNCSNSFVSTILHVRYCTLANEVTTANSHGDDVKSIKQIKNIFKCTSEEAKTIFHQVTPFDLKTFRIKLTFLLENGATLPVLMEYCQLLSTSSVDLLRNFKLLSDLPWKKTDDFIPFLAVTKPKLSPKKIRELPHRVYHLAERLKVEPIVVSKYMRKHSALWVLHFEIIKNNLQMLMDHDQYLSPINILRDLHILQRNEESISHRFDDIESVSAVKKAMPWMLKCQEKTFERSMELYEQRGELINYLAKQLKWNLKTRNKFDKECPNLRKDTYIKKYKNAVKVLDILLSHLDAKTISDNIDIVFLDFELIEQRCSELESAGISLNESTLHLLRAPRRRFTNHLEKHSIKFHSSE